MTYKLHLGDCLDVLRDMPTDSVDSIVTDPPYGLSFMGKKWDYDVPSTEIWAECLRVLKPGGHLLAFAGTRTQHRMAVRIEDAGFEIRDMIAWVYGSGFPKSGNTALKPALEPITMARKPLIGTVAANALLFGTGPLNIDDCRVEPTGESRPLTGEATQDQRYTEQGGTNFAVKPGVRGGDPAGRWPANLIHDGGAEVVAMFPHTKSGTKSPHHVRTTSKTKNSYGERAALAENFPGDEGSAARFFYCAKTGKKDRNEGLDAFPETTTKTFEGGKIASGKTPDSMGGERTSRNNHPTVKPTDLMAYLLRLVTPPGGIALDPFMGSGSTGKAAMREGFQFIGCELDEAYLAIAKARIDHEVARMTEEASRPRDTQADLFTA